MGTTVPLSDDTNGASSSEERAWACGLTLPARGNDISPKGDATVLVDGVKQKESLLALYAGGGEEPNDAFVAAAADNGPLLLLL